MFRPNLEKLREIEAHFNYFYFYVKLRKIAGNWSFIFLFLVRQIKENMAGH